MKSYEQTMLEIYKAIFADCSVFFPLDRKAFARDYARICRLVQNHGLRFATRDLVDLCKHFDRSLCSGNLTLPRIPGLKAQKRGGVLPRLFGGLLTKIFNDDGSLVYDPDPTAVFLFRQLTLVAKKIQLPCTERIVNETIQTFQDTDRALSIPNWNWESAEEESQEKYSWSLTDYHSCGSPSCCSADMASNRGSNLQVVQQVSDFVVTILIGHIDYMVGTPKHGPGVVAVPMAKSYKYDFTNWNQRLDSFFPMSDLAFANINHMDAVIGDIGQEEISSRLCVVPKTQKAPRLIAAEPVEHQWCQQILMDYFYKLPGKFRRKSGRSYFGHSIFFHNQEENREAARRASIDGSSATIDLSAASDRLSLRFIERWARNNVPLLEALRASRTLSVSSTNWDDPIVLRKYAPMGNATTFPIQTFCFYTIAVAAVLCSRALAVTSRNIDVCSREVRVFGDDIIIPSDSVEILTQLLEDVELKVNIDKSCTAGLFRESCGMDAFMGYDVSPAYWHGPCESKPESIVSTVECSNNFYSKGLLHTAEYVRTTLGRNVPYVSCGSGRFGLSCRTSAPTKAKIRWNKKLQRIEAKVWRVYTRQTVESIPTYGPLLQYFIEEPAMDLPWVSGARGRPCLRLRQGWEGIHSYRMDSHFAST